MLKAAVCGLGIGMAHCAGYMESTDAELVAVCDLQPHRRERIGGTFAAGSMRVLEPLFDASLFAGRWEDIGVRAYASLDELLENGDFDLISLCTPDYLHAEQAVRILRAGKHLMLEKPVALTLDDAQRVARAAGEAAERGIRSALGYEFRVNPAVTFIKQLVADDVIGSVEACSLHHYRTPFKRDKFEHWIQKRETSGGLIVEETSHWFDLARFLSGREIETLHCVTNDTINTDFDFEDIAFINGTMSDGAILQIAHSLTGFDFSLVVTLHGRKGTIWCGLKDSERSLLDAGQTTYCAAVAWGPVGGQPNQVQTRTFEREATEAFTLKEHVRAVAAAIARGEAVPCTIEDGAAALAAALAAGRSAREASIVTIADRSAIENGRGDARR